MKTRMMILLMVALLAASIASAQKCTVSCAGGGGGQLPPPWFLISVVCNPVECSDNSTYAMYSGRVQTSAVGYCVDGLIMQVSAQAWVANCTAPYFLDSHVNPRLETTRWYTWPSGKMQLEDLEGIGAYSQILTDTMIPTGQPYYDVWMCDNEHRTGLPILFVC